MTKTGEHAGPGEGLCMACFGSEGINPPRREEPPVAAIDILRAKYIGLLIGIAGRDEYDPKLCDHIEELLDRWMGSPDALLQVPEEKHG